MKHPIFLKNGFSTFSLMLLLFATALTVFSQSLDRISRGRAKDMLGAVKAEIKKNYYDSTFRGIDLDARFKVAEEKLDQATSLGQAFGIVAQAVLDLNDSHTTFYPPSRAAKFDYGWRMQMIGNKCYVVAVKPKSDAEKQGLKPGDQVLSVEGFRPTRKEMWKMMYYYNSLSPRPGLKLLIQSPNANEQRELNIASKVTTLKGVLNFEDLIREYEMQDFDEFHRYQKVGNTIVWKMPSFVFDPAQVDGIMRNKINGHAGLILDLRGNGGGLVVTLEKLAGYFVEKDTKIADLKGRKEMKPQSAKTQGSNVFKGKLIVLIDSSSGSASEIFARLMQLEGRGVVIGDQSAGAVMQSRGFPMQMGVDTVIPYGMSVTMADVIMSDGKSLEHIGVTPNLLSLPTGADLSVERDPVMSQALELLGEKVSPEATGKFFPIQWRK